MPKPFVQKLLIKQIQKKIRSKFSDYRMTFNYNKNCLNQKERNSMPDFENKLAK